MDAPHEPVDRVGATRIRDGQFKFTNLPAGTYYAIAVDYVAAECAETCS